MKCSEPVLFVTRAITYCAAGDMNADGPIRSCPHAGEQIETGYYFIEMPDAKFCLDCGKEIAEMRGNRRTEGRIYETRECTRCGAEWNTYPTQPGVHCAACRRVLAKEKRRRNEIIAREMFLQESLIEAPVSIGGIQELVAGYYGVSVEDMIGDARAHQIVNARHSAIYLCRELLRVPLGKVAAAFLRNVSTTIYACAQVRAENPPEIEVLRARILDLSKRSDDTPKRSEKVGSGRGTD